MHDAVLVEHEQGSDAQIVVEVFEKTMTTFFNGKIQGQASVSEFTDG